jgi:hypothetical protein
LILRKSIQLALICLSLLLVTGCRHEQKSNGIIFPPDISKPHAAIPTTCIQEVRWFEGWCEPGKEADEYLCHEVVLRVPSACVVIDAGHK